MIRHIVIGVFVAAWPLLAGAQNEISGDKNGTIGYPSVSAAMSDLFKRPDLVRRDFGEWLILEDHKTRSVWSFAKKGHAAYPTAVRRTIVTEGGVVRVRTRILCQAEKDPCDRVNREFKKLNEQMQARLQQQARGRQPVWSPGADIKEKAVSRLTAFLKAMDEDRYKEIYEMLAPRLKRQVTKEQYAALQRRFDQIGGGKPERGDIRFSWYKDPPNAPEPGIYGAINISCKAPKHSYCGEIIVLHKNTSEEFSVLRYERSFVDPATARRLREQSR